MESSKSEGMPPLPTMTVTAMPVLAMVWRMSGWLEYCVAQ